MSLPHSKVAVAPSDRKGPNGIGSFRFFIFSSRRIPATNPPRITPINKATNTRGKPVTRPISPTILTSPHPIPPRKTRATIKSRTKPTAPPMTPLKILGSGRNIRLLKSPASGKKESMARMIRAAAAAG